MGKSFSNGFGGMPAGQFHRGWIDEPYESQFIRRNDSIPYTGQSCIQPLPALPKLTLQLVSDKSSFNCGKDLLFVKWIEHVPEGPSSTRPPDRRLTTIVNHVNDGCVMIITDVTTSLYA